MFISLLLNFSNSKPFNNPVPPNISIHILHTIRYTFSQGADKENLFNNQELL